MLRPGLVFGSGVKLAIFGRLLALIFLVMPGQAGFDLCEVHVFSLNDNFSHQPSILISLGIQDRDLFSKDEIGEILLRTRAKRLM